MHAPRSSFVGRTAELEAAGSAIAKNRLVTVTGMGGAGKTRLALELAAGAALRHRDGVAVVELAPVQTEGGIVAAISGALGVEPNTQRPADDRLGRLATMLRTRELLLVVDNCEHVLTHAARIIDRLLDTCPGLRVLATSREALRLAGEHTINVGSLPVEPCSVERPSEAVRLFIERAAAARSGLTLDEDTIADVVTVCRTVDGIPLAIELAAARVSTCPPPRSPAVSRPPGLPHFSRARHTRPPSDAHVHPGLELRAVVERGAFRPPGPRRLPPRRGPRGDRERLRGAMGRRFRCSRDHERTRRQEPRPDRRP